LAWIRGAPGALPWTTDRDVGAACIHNSLYVHQSSSGCWMRSTDVEQHWPTMNPTGSSHTAARSSQRSSARSPKTQPCACQTGQWKQALPTSITVWRSTGNARSTTTRWSATLEQLSTTWTQPSTSNSIVGVLSPRKSRNTCKNGTRLLTNIMIYWVTQIIGSSVRRYYVDAHTAPHPWQRTAVPAAVAHCPQDAPLPREWAERRVNLKHFTEFPHGGHFMA